MSGGINWDEYISDGAKWTRITAPMALSILLDRLKRMGGPLTYDELATEIYQRFGEPQQENKQKYGWPLGAAAFAAIGEGKKVGLEVPPLSLIVINSATGYPGKGADIFVPALKRRRVRLAVGSPKRREILDKEVAAVWAWGTERWEALESALRVPPLPNPRRLRPKIGPPPVLPKGGGVETAAHKNLKKWVAEHPGKFKDFGHFAKGENELQLLSGDRIDAMLVGPTARLAVEVKASNATETELIRGIFQCVKYRATMEAEVRSYAEYRLPGSCLLVSTVPLSSKAQGIADMLGVRFRKVSMKCES